MVYRPARRHVGGIRRDSNRREDEAVRSVPQQSIGAGGHDLLVPVWREVGRVLADTKFDPERPDLHASHAWIKSGDWASAERCIYCVPDYRTQPALLSRMAEAIWRQKKRWVEAADHWFALCWLAPDEFQCLMERGGIQDRTLREGWYSGLDRDLEPEMTAAWFPAWMLLYKSGLAQWIAPPTGTSASEAEDFIDRGPADVLHRLTQLGWAVPRPNAKEPG